MTVLFVLSLVAVIVLICLSAAAGGMIPLCMANRLSHKQTLEYCQAFTSGTLLTLGLVHILPDAIKDMATADFRITLNGNRFDPTPILVLSGYIATLFLETMVTTAGFEVPKGAAGCASAVPKAVHESGAHEGCGLSDTKKNSDDEIEKDGVFLSQATWQGSKAVDFEPTWAKGEGSAAGHPPGGPMDFGEPPNALGEAVPNIILMATLSCHGVMEGLIIGGRSDIYSFWLSSSIIVIHKWAESLAIVSSSIQQLKSKSYARRSLAVFVCMTPMGILLGLLLNALSPLGTAVINALSAGTLLSVASEMATILQTGRSAKSLKFALMLTGCCTVTAFTLLDEALTSSVL